MTKVVCDFCGNNAEFIIKRLPVISPGWLEAAQLGWQGKPPYQAEICFACITKLKAVQNKMLEEK